jgi:hypothetical protein
VVSFQPWFMHTCWGEHRDWDFSSQMMSSCGRYNTMHQDDCIENQWGRNRWTCSGVRVSINLDCGALKLGEAYCTTNISQHTPLLKTKWKRETKAISGE